MNVLIIGGGASGMAAALTAARQGWAQFSGKMGRQPPQLFGRTPLACRKVICQAIGRQHRLDFKVAHVCRLVLVLCKSIRNRRGIGR